MVVRFLNKAEIVESSDATYLRYLVALGQYGHACTPRNFYMGDPDRIAPWGPFEGRVDPSALYCEYYHSRAHWDVDFERYKRIARLSKRYRRLVHYVTEIKPQWQAVDKIEWADNSVDVIERAADGRERSRMVKAPSGDACF